MPKTYAKRHRAKTSSDVVDRDGDRNISRTNQRQSGTEGPPRKKVKSATAPMSSSFETPHPTLEAQKQAYKLPSSKPTLSPTPLSPVPIPIQNLASRNSKSSHQHASGTSSRSLKENANSTLGQTPRSRPQLSEAVGPFAALPFEKGPILPERDKKSQQKGRNQFGRLSRSASRSSNSSRASSKESLESNTRSNQKRKSKPKALKVNTDPDVLKSRSGIRRTATKSTSKPLRPHLLAATSEPAVLLASPFASRASSPTIPHTSNRDREAQGKMGPPAPSKPTPARENSNKSLRRALTDTLFDPNAPDRSRGRSRHSVSSAKHNFSQSLSRPNTPDKPSQVASKTSRNRKRNAYLGKYGEDNEAPWKDRRPSAPSNLQRPKPTKPMTVGARPKKKNDQNEMNMDLAGEKRLGSGLELLLASAPPADAGGLQAAHPLNPIGDDPCAWMHARTGVDFNRPPSQMSNLMGWDGGQEVDDAFLSSEESEEEDERPHFEFGSGSGLGVEGFEKNTVTSTPGRTLAKPKSLSTLDLEGRGWNGIEYATVKARSMSMSMDLDLGVGMSLATHDGTGEDIEEDMDLTAPVYFGDENTGPGEGTAQQENEDEEQRDEGTTWITDSIVSPPTMYQKAPKAKAEAHNSATRASNYELGHSDFLPLLMRTGQSTPPPGHSYSQSSSSSGVSGLAEAFEVRDSSNVKETENAVTKRSRSGTIVPARPIHGGDLLNTGSARRTRSGTIVGPSNVGSRTRSGTILAKAPQFRTEEGAGWSENGMKRTRSGTIVGPIPPSTVTAGRRARSGSLLASSLNKGTRSPAAAGQNGAEDYGHELDPRDPTGSRAAGSSGVSAALATAGLEANDERGVECYTDSLYLPRLTSSPDPIDFLSFTSIVEDEEGEADVDDGFGADGGEAKAMAWCVAYDPPSPEVTKKKADQIGNRLRGPFKGLAGLGARLAKKVKGKNNSKFVGDGGEGNVEGGEGHVEEDLSDDELLLRSDG